MPKSAEHMPVVEFADLEIRGPAERYRTSMPKYFPKSLRALYRDRRAGAVDGFTGSNCAINEIERQNLERSDLCHRLPLSGLWSENAASGANPLNASKPL
jgi:hypothetical protein